MADPVELNSISSVSRTKAVARKSSVQQPGPDRKRPAPRSGQGDEEQQRNEQEQRIGSNIDEQC